ncbi:hypothetical protein PCANC_15211 [Puccinia coronata f. sp. avenae]|uniref:RxLR effector protein n=1 Tax=Puccinia coronata f. sp. avenae TaxID=200324 RepID=A0A2N5UF95_9BASI|nr:hypothetical protein PCANC_15211 [Puccinia coronata f. sp. avenae]
MLGKTLLSLLLISIPAIRNTPAYTPNVELDGVARSGVELEKTIPTEPENKRQSLHTEVQESPKPGYSASKSGSYLVARLGTTEKKKKIALLQEDQIVFWKHKNELEAQLEWLGEVYQSKLSTVI